MDSAKLLLFAIFVATSQAGPVYKLHAAEEKACALTCSESSKLKYEPGNIYEFTYNAETKTKMNGASEDSAFMVIEANIEIEPITKCDLVMRISDATLRDSGDALRSQVFKEAMTKQALKFSFQDGRIDHICSMDGESTWTLNIKRGILSAFQNSMDNFDRDQNLTETDVVGTCLSEYKIIDKDPKTKFVEKKKYLNGCSNREGYQLAVQSIRYNVPSFVKSLPLMKSEYKCTQTLDLGSNILQSSTCTEEHVFRPFSYGKNGAMTSTEQTLTFTNKRRAGRSSDDVFSQRSTLLFHHQNGKASKEEKEEKIEAKLQELCQKATEDIRPEVPEMVNQLIEHMRQVDRDVLSRVYRKINQRAICGSKSDRIKQYFHDAIPMVGTAASVGMIQDLISKKHVTGSEAEMWLLSLSFVQHPTKEMIEAATPLLNERDISGNSLLAVSSLASSYCNIRPDCGKDQEISALIRKLMDLTENCNSQNGDARKIVFALRALGNIGHSHEAVSLLTRCFTRQDVREEIRIAAMDAFRKIPCDSMRSDLMGVFRDESEDSEIRINAYIAMMKCPSRVVLSQVREVLAKEKSNQVGSFIWSHLANLMETSDPHMQDIRNIVDDEELKGEFNLDQRKYSRNYEGSFFFDTINTGAKVDSNVIFSQKSFIPRSANLNLTIDLFGHAINFFEFGGRVQGMERILENFFGTLGHKIPTMKTKVPLNFEKTMDAFRASAYMRVFGNELRYWDDQSLNELKSSLRKLMNMQALTFSKTMVLFDSTMIIPTCVGLPLNLTMSSTGSISLDTKASIQRNHLSVDFKPSASVQVKGEMSVDAHVSRAGLKMVTVAHTSTGAKLDIRENKVDLQIPQKKMEIFNLKTDFYIVHRNAEKKQKMIVDNVKKHEICTGKFMKQITGLTFCQKLQFPNASHHNEAPFFPFTGPIAYDLYMMNEDAPNGYIIEGFTKQSPYSFYIDTPNSKISRRIAIETVRKNRNEAHVTFKAPWNNIKIEGTIMNKDEMKALTAKLSLNDRTEYVLDAALGMKNIKGLLSFTPRLEITIPQNKMKYEGKIEFRPMKTLLIDMSAMGFIADDISLKISGEIVPKEIGLTSQLKIGKKGYYIATRVGKLITKTGFKFTPSLKITIPSKDIIEFTSEILYESKKKISFDFKLNKVFRKTVAMNAIILLNAGKTKTKHILRVLFKSPRGNFRIIGDIDNKKAGIASRFIGSYNFGAKYSDRLTLSSKIRNLSVKKSVRYMGNIALASKKQEFLNFNLKGQLAKANNHLETKFDLHYGNPKIKTNNLKFACVLNRALKTYVHAYDYAMAIQHPGQKINYKIEANHVQSATWPFKKLENTVKIQMAPGKVVETKLSYNNAKVKGLLKYETEISLSYPGRNMKMVDKLTQVNKNRFEGITTVQWQKGRDATLESSYTKTGKDVHNIDATFRLPNKKEAKVSAMVQTTTRDYKSKFEFSADEGMILRQRINYMAEGSFSYIFNAKQISSDVKAEVMWAPNQKISGNINFDYMKRNSFSSKIVFSTPFNTMKNFESQTKFTWENSKYTSTMHVTWNKENELKNEFAFSYPNFQLSNDASLVFNGKKSEFVLAMKHSDMFLNGNVKVSHDKTTIFEIMLQQNSQRTDIESEISLDFDILDSNGKMKITFKYDKRRGEIMSNGEGKLNLPLQQLRQIGASYNLKHNNDLSSIDMNYSSSLRNYRNGKMSIEVTRNLPKMLKATVEMKLNGNPMLNINADYERKRDNINVKADMTGPDGEKMSASGNINFSGGRKTANVEIKSRTVEFDVDGAFEYHGISSADGNLKVTINRENMMISGNYKRDATTFKVSSTLGLFDGRTIKMEGSLDLENMDASFKTMSPEFPQLTEIDMSLSLNNDRRMLSSTASLKIMPYFDRIQAEMKFTKKQFNLEMNTQFKSMKQSKFTVKFDGDWFQSQTIQAIFELNNKKMFDVDMKYNLNSANNFVVSINAVTSHRRYKDFQFEMKNNGPLNNMQFGLKVKLPNVIMLDAMMQNTRKISKASFNAQLLDFDEWKSTFELKGNLDMMTVNIITNIANEEVNKIEFSLKEYGRSINVMVNGPKSVRFDFNMDIDIELITFNMASSFTLDGRDKYEMSASYEHLSKLLIKTSIPSYKDELSIMFSGNVKAFKFNSKFTHNNDVYEMIVSNKEYYRQLKAVLNTPYFQDTALFKLDGELSAMNIFAQLMHNNDKYEMTFSNNGYYEKMNAQIDTPYFKPTMKFTLTGNPENFNLQFMIQNGNDIYELKAANEQSFRKMNLLLNTPYINWDFQYEGDLYNTEASFTILYDNKKYELTISNKDFFQDYSLNLITPKHTLKVKGKLDTKKKTTNGDFSVIYNKKKFSLSGTYKDMGSKKILKAGLNTPYFKDSLSGVFNGNLKKFSADVKLIHKGDTYEVSLSNKNIYKMIDLNINAPGFEGKFDFEGELIKFKSFASVKMSNDMYSFGVSNVNYVRNINIEVNSPQTGKIMLSYDLQANINNFHFTAQFSFRNDKYDFNLLRDSETGDHKLTMTSPQVSVDGLFNGNLERFSFSGNIVYQGKKYEIMASSKSYFREISAKLITPQLGEQSLLVKINGQLKNFNGLIEVKNNDEIYKSKFSLENQEFRLTLPKFLQNFQLKLKGNWKNFDFVMQAMNYNGKRIEMNAFNKNFKEMKAHLAIPHLIDDIDAYVKTSGNLQNGKANMKMSFGENIFENQVEISFDGNQANFAMKPNYKILGRSGNSKVKIDLMFDAQTYKYEFEADIEGSQLKSMGSIKIQSEISALMTFNMPTFEDSEMKLRLVSTGFQKTDMMLNLKSPWTGMTKVFYEHNGQFGKSFNTKGYIERDGLRFANYLLETEFENDYGFHLILNYGDSKNQFEAKGDLKFQGVKTVATLTLSTPFENFREFFFSAQTKMLRDGPSVELDMKLPNQEYSLNIDLSNSNFNVLLNVNMDKRNKNKQYQFQISYKNNDHRSDLSRSFNFKMVLPQRTFTLDSRFENNRQSSLVASAHAMWGETTDQKIGFELMIEKARQAKLRIITPGRVIQLFGKVKVNGDNYSTIGRIMMDENNEAQTVDIKADIVKTNNGADIDLTVKFPNQKKGMNLKTSINFAKGDIIFSSKSEFSMDQDPQKTFKISSKLMSEIKGKRQMYTMQIDAEHAHTGFSIELINRLSITPEKYIADIEMGYLNVKRKQQKFVIHGEVNIQNREVNFKVEAPSKTLELDGSLRNGNRYMISLLKKESGKENMEALFKLNPTSRRMNIIFNYDETNPNKLYRIDGDIMKSRATFKAYRINKQKKQSLDGRITLELKTNNLFQSHIKWNPDILEDLNVFGYEKLRMYGNELKSFGDSLSQFMNDELSMKFALAKRSFGEDMEAIRDYFHAESSSLSNDFDRVITFVNQMVEEDAFYIKSTMKAIENANDKMWISYNKYLNQMEKQMEEFNRKIKELMDDAQKQFDFYYSQYSRQLKNNFNNFVDDIQYQYKMMHELAMEMEYEIISFIRNYPRSMKGLMNKMRQNEYGEKILDMLMSMYEAINEKKIEAQDHMDTLTSAIYSAHATLNRHIARARRHPIVDVIFDNMNQIYQQVLWSYNYWDVKENILGLKTRLYKFGAEKIKEIKHIITDVGMSTLVFDPKNGEIMIQIRFGAAKYAYNHFMSSIEDLERAVMKFKNLIPHTDFNVWDIYYMMKPSSDLYDYIPPFKAEGTLFAGQHITTFDGRHFEYKGTCSYLLARDFVDGNFTVVANFDTDRRTKTLKSLSLTTALNEVVEIFPDNRVLLNRRVVKLPLQLTDATVTRQGNTIIVDSNRRYKIICDHDTQLYTVQISGWYFNKMAGLFGNYNNEPVDDMLMSNSKYTNDLEQFAQSWSVSRKCRSHRNFAPNHMVPENRECAYFFLETDSPFRYCFRQVNPNQFYKTCAMQMSYSKATPMEMCKISSFYLSKCHMKGVYLSMPDMCPKKMY